MPPRQAPDTTASSMEVVSGPITLTGTLGYRFER